MKQFGSAKNFSGQVGERVLKTIVKNHAQQTQRRVNIFALQCADREYESQVYKYAYDNICHQFTNQNSVLLNPDFEIASCKGKFTMQFTNSDQYGCGDANVTWADKYTQQM